MILADEPTGNLDTGLDARGAGDPRAAHRQGRTIILITHEHEVAAHADRIIQSQRR